MTRPLATDVPARPAACGALLLRVVVGLSLVVGALLFVVGMPRGVGALVSDDRPGLTRTHSVLAGSDGVRASGSVVAATLVDVDGCAEVPFPVDPASHVPPRLSASGFRPHGRPVVRARESSPPDRPPRHA